MFCPSIELSWAGDLRRSRVILGMNLELDLVSILSMLIWGKQVDEIICAECLWFS